jgi:hypothetical protein
MINKICTEKYGRLKSKCNILKQRSYSNFALQQTISNNTARLTRDDSSGLNNILHTQGRRYPEYIQDLRKISNKNYSLIYNELGQALD